MITSKRHRRLLKNYRQHYKVAEDFDNVYRYIYSLLTDANIHKDKETLEKALNEIRGMRDTWKQVMKSAKSV